MHVRDLALALLANCAWAFNFIAGKYGLGHFPPFFFTAMRFTLVFLLLLPFLRPVPKPFWPVLRLGLILGVGHFSLSFAGLAASADVASVAIATQLYVPFATLLAIFLLGEKLNWHNGLGVAAAFAGVMIISFDPVVFEHPLSLLLVTAAAALMAIASILMRTLRGVGVFQLQAWIGLIAAPNLFALSFLFESDQALAWETATTLQFASAAYTALGASIVGHGLAYYLLQRYPVSTVTPLLLLSPVLAIVFGVLLLDDQLSWRLVVGGIATLGGVLSIALRPKAAEPLAH